MGGYQPHIHGKQLSDSMNIWLFLSILCKSAPAPTEVNPIFAFGLQEDQFIPDQAALSQSLLQLSPSH